MDAAFDNILPRRRSATTRLWSDDVLDLLPEIAAAPLEKIESVARKSVLTLAPRPGRPWLDGYPRIIHLRDSIGEDFPGCGILGQKMLPIGGEESAFEFLKKGVVDLAVSRMGRHHLWAWATDEVDALLLFVEWLRATHHIELPPNVWLGTRFASGGDRVARLLQAGPPDTRRFVIVEPLSEQRVDLKPYLSRLHWCIAGSALQQKTAYSFCADAARALRDDCRRAGTPLFLTSISQPGASQTDQASIDWASWPSDLQVREFPDPTCLLPGRKAKVSMRAIRAISTHSSLLAAASRSSLSTVASRPAAAG